MRQTKQLLVLIFLTILAINSFASINAPAEIVANANWTFSVSADTTKDISFDNSKIVSVYSNGQAIKDPINGSQVLDAFVFDRTVYISLSGASVGTHTISTSDGESFSVNAISPSGQQISDELNSKFDEMTQANESLTRQVNSLEQDIIAKDQKIEELRTLIDQSTLQLSSNTEQTQNSISQISDQQATQKNELTQELNTITARVDRLDEKVFPKPVQTKETQQTPITGLATFAQKNWMGIFLILIAVVVSVFFITRKKTVSFSGGKKSVYEDFDRIYDPSISNAKSYQDIKDAQKAKETLDAKGKWASKE